MENNNCNEMSFERVQNICYEISNKVCDDHQKAMERTCQCQRENIASVTDVKLGDISAGIKLMCSRFDEHLKLHEKSENFWKWFAAFMVVLVGASSYIQKIFN